MNRLIYLLLKKILKIIDNFNINLIARACSVFRAGLRRFAGVRADLRGFGLICIDLSSCEFPQWAHRNWILDIAIVLNNEVA